MARRSTRQAALAACALWVLRYWIAYGLHLRSAPYWTGWFDQERYVESAAAFARADLTAAHHWYPLAYSLLAAPFAVLIPGDPFFVVDCLSFGGVFLGFAAIVRRMGIGPWPALAILVLTSLIVDRTAQLWLIPWTTSLAAALTWIALALAVHLLEEGEDRNPASRQRALFALGVIAGALPLVRPTEAMTSALILLAAGVWSWRQGRLRWREVGVVAVGAAVAVLPYALLYGSIYGIAPSRYMVESARQGFAFADLGWKAYVLLITARPWYLDAPSLVEGMPWLIPGLAGLLLALWRPARRTSRRVVMLVGLVAIPYTMLFLAYTDLQPNGLWRFNNAQYFKWLFPLLGAGAWVWMRELIVGRRIALCLALLTAVLLPACARIVPVGVTEEVPARLLTFAGRTDRDWNEAYFARSVVVDRVGVMRNVQHFHQLPDSFGERAIAITRLFAAAPRRSDPGEAPALRRDAKPVGRFAGAVEIGWPCWIAPRACDGAIGRGAGR